MVVDAEDIELGQPTRGQVDASPILHRLSSDQLRHSVASKNRAYSACWLQQVGDAAQGCSAFTLSEWAHVLPNEWQAEGPAIIGAYGLGLQG